jgi:3-hydroxybutyrate dehydrogenase
VRGLLADVTDRAALAAAIDGLGRIDVLVNNAGLERETRLDDPAAAETFERIVAINVTGIFNVTAAALPAMTTGAAVVNTASIWGRVAPAGYSAYAASKHAVIGLTRAHARELGPRGIRVNAVCPGWVETAPALDTLATMAARRELPEAALRAEIEAEQDLPGLMAPADVADLYLFLASDLSRNLTGQAVNVDRGAVHS